MIRVVKSTLVTTALVLAGLAAGSSPAWAGGCNLYTTTATCAFNGAGFAVDATQPTGTGVIDSFLRIQQNGIEQGYNTSARPVEFDEKTDPNYTRNLTTAEVPVVTNPTPSLPGNYLEFFLDINESANPPESLLTLDQLQLFVSNTPSIEDGYSSTGGGTLTGATQIYSMDTATQNNFVNLDYNLVGGGSGSGDMVVYIPEPAGFSNYQYVYLYSEFGCVPDSKGTCGNGANEKYSSDAGFEEWWTLSPVTPPPPVPEPGTLLLVGSGIVAAARRFRLA